MVLHPLQLKPSVKGGKIHAKKLNYPGQLLNPCFNFVTTASTTKPKILFTFPRHPSKSIRLKSLSLGFTLTPYYEKVITTAGTGLRIYKAHCVRNCTAPTALKHAPNRHGFRQIRKDRF